MSASGSNEISLKLVNSHDLPPPEPKPPHRAPQTRDTPHRHPTPRKTHPVEAATLALRARSASHHPHTPTPIGCELLKNEILPLPLILLGCAARLKKLRHQHRNEIMTAFLAPCQATQRSTLAAPRALNYRQSGRSDCRSGPLRGLRPKAPKHPRGPTKPILRAPGGASSAQRSFCHPAKPARDAAELHLRHSEHPGFCHRLVTRLAPPNRSPDPLIPAIRTLVQIGKGANYTCTFAVVQATDNRPCRPRRATRLRTGRSPVETAPCGPDDTLRPGIWHPRRS